MTLRNCLRGFEPKGEWVAHSKLSKSEKMLRVYVHKKSEPKIIGHIFSFNMDRKYLGKRKTNRRKLINDVYSQMTKLYYEQNKKQ